MASFIMKQMMGSQLDKVKGKYRLQKEKKSRNCLCVLEGGNSIIFTFE